MAFERLIERGKKVAAWVERPTVFRVLQIVLPLAFLGLLVAKAWLAEDAYITFRVIDNALHGYGLRWNIDERVQVYTHPLWMFANLLVMACTREEFFTGIGLSLVVSMACYLLLQRGYRAQPLVVVGMLFLPLAMSRSILEFFVSGLENPLASLLLAVFFLMFLRGKRVPWFWLGLTASGLLLTRFDLVWFVLPVALFLLATQWHRLRWGKVLLASLPLAGWCIFSLLYYGFVFPNTKYAKLNTGIAWDDTIRQGLRYYADFFWNDMPSCYLLVLAVGYAAYRLVRHRWEALYDRHVMVALGVVIYLGYLLAIGGDYMSGRFFTAPLTVTLILLADVAWCSTPQQRRIWVLFVAMGVLVLGLIGRYTEVIDVVGSNGIANERQFYKKRTSLLGNLPDKKALDTYHWVQSGRALRHTVPEGLRGVMPQMETRGNAGMNPYFGGPHIAYIDPFGLADALLARLPLVDRRSWRIGHFVRILPAGYRQFRETGDASAMDADLAVYAQALHTIIADPFWSWERLRTLVAFQLGAYDQYRDRYVAQVLQRTDWPLSRITHPRQMQVLLDEVVDYAEALNMTIAVGTPYRFSSPRLVKAKALHVAALKACHFQFDFEKDGQVLGTVRTGEVRLPPQAQKQYIDEYEMLVLPPAVRRGGFDTLVVTYAGHPRLPGPSCMGMAPTLLYVSFD